MEEEHVWANIKQRDQVIFHNNDFEIFLKPYAENTHYAEIEINALGTVWDLLLMNAYREGGPIINDWNIEGLQVGVHVDGKINNSKNKDKRNSWNEYNRAIQTTCNSFCRNLIRECTNIKFC